LKEPESVKRDFPKVEGSVVASTPAFSMPNAPADSHGEPIPEYDRPQFKFEKKKSALDDVGFQIRKPGEKS
jgi:hypothetical protein